MKKISIYTLGALMGVALVACDDYKEPNPPAQSNQAPVVLKTSDVTVASQVASSTYDLSSLAASDAMIPVATISCDVLPEGYSFEAVAYISGDDFENSFELPTTMTLNEDDSWTASVNPTDLSNTFQEDIDWSNDEATIAMRLKVATVYANQGGDQVAYIGGENYYYGPYSLTILPIPVDLHFSNLYTPGSANDWNQNASQLLTTDNFTTYYGFAYLGETFKFTSADNWDGYNFGAGEEEGTLSTDPEAGNLTVEVAGLYWCDVNVEALTYSLYQIETVSMIGDFNDWAGDVEMTPSDDYLTWTGTLVLEEASGWKFRMNDDWTVNLGGTDDDLVNNGANLNNEAGTYAVTLDLSKLPYSCTVVAQ